MIAQSSDVVVPSVHIRSSFVFNFRWFSPFGTMSQGFMAVRMMFKITEPSGFRTYNPLWSHESSYFGPMLRLRVVWQCFGFLEGHFERMFLCAMQSYPEGLDFSGEAVSTSASAKLKGYIHDLIPTRTSRGMHACMCAFSKSLFATKISPSLCGNLFLTSLAIAMKWTWH